MATFEHIYRRLPKRGWLSRNEARLLYNYARITKGDIVEVGSYHGRSATLLASLRRNVYCIDPWDDLFSTDEKGDDIYKAFCSNTAGYPVIPIRMKVEDWIPISAEFVYLDGDHTYEGTLTQIHKALQCGPKYVGIHDVNDSGDGLQIKNAALNLLGEWLVRIERLAIWKITQP